MYMKYLLLNVFFVGLIVSSCSKSPVDPMVIVEPPEPVEIILDSIIEGTLHGMTVGDGAEQVYTDLQLFTKTKETTTYLSITGQLNPAITDLNERVPLYASLIFDRKPSSPAGGQIYFEGNLIKTIYNREGKKLTSWPNPSSNALRVGDSVEDIYGKLVKIHADSRFSNLFDYIGMFHKDTDKAYDPVQRLSNLWQFNFSIDEKNVIRLDLIFANGTLTKIKSRHERYL